MFHSRYLTQTKSCALQCCLFESAPSCTSFLQSQQISSLAAVLASGRRVDVGFQSCGSTHPQSSAEGIHVHMVLGPTSCSSSVHLIYTSLDILYKGFLVGGIASMFQCFFVNSPWHASSTCMFTTFEVWSCSSTVNHSSEATWPSFTSTGPVDKARKFGATSPNAPPCVPCRLPWSGVNFRAEIQCSFVSCPSPSLLEFWNKDIAVPCKASVALLSQDCTQCCQWLMFCTTLHAGWEDTPLGLDDTAHTEMVANDCSYFHNSIIGHRQFCISVLYCSNCAIVCDASPCLWDYMLGPLRVIPTSAIARNGVRPYLTVKIERICKSSVQFEHVSMYNTRCFCQTDGFIIIVMHIGFTQCKS